MTDLIKIEDVKNRMLTIRGELSLLAGDVAALYGVEPREIAQAVKNNPAKFPEGYVFDLAKDEIASLKSKFLTLENAPGRGHYSKRGYNRNRIFARTQLLHRQAQAHRPPRSSRRTPERRPRTTFKNYELRMRNEECTSSPMLTKSSASSSPASKQ